MGEGEPIAGEARVIRPGDNVLIRLPSSTTAEQADQMLQELRARMPDVMFCVIAGVDGIDVYRPGSPGEDGSG
ncbi:hypothetical protein QMZ92_16380 [Streptomyces sp. HNM0645]|uniref:hypothetical protein n=1 Tax=Streptomyces sp. HNM0645 TaxID=2782343 RepID=UPI0024B8107D|nr:hypothetical protein [Streptomyces sp. HNM0645]MDI9885912.1 hypothetical protein [Streptomyces sp. HNM0645]